MATKKRLDQLPAILSGDVGNNDLMYLVHENAQAETGYDSNKILVAEVAKKLLGGVELPTDLPDFPANEQNALSALEYLNAKINDLYPVVTESGSLASFTTPLALPLVSLKANITATQSGTGTPSPSNPRPISGFSSVKFAQTGKNLFENSLNSQTYNGVIFTVNSDGSITLGGQATTEVIRSFHLYLPAGSYIYTSGITEDYATYDTYITKGGSTIARGREGWNVFTLTEYSDLVYGIRVRNGVSPNITIKPMIRISTDTDNTFEPYNANTFTIALGDTYYGGVLDCKNGTATITHRRVDLGSLSWNIGSGGATRFVSTIASNPPKSSGNIICDCYQTSTNTAIYAGSVDDAIALHTTGAIWVRDTDYTTADAFKTAMDGKYAVYELATPITLSGLTPDNFTTIQGENNIFADSGDVEVSFKQGIQEYIDEQIATTQALIL